MHMAQDKPTSIRILQSHKKKTLSPALLVMSGFLAGILVSISGFIIFLKSSNNTSENNPIRVESTAVDDKTETAQQTPNVEHTTNHAHAEHVVIQHETDDDEAIQQPKDSDLSKLFQHAPVAAAVPRVSPFEVTKTPSPAQKPVSTAKVVNQPKVSDPKKSTVQAEKNTVAQPEAEKIESPKASVEIAVTRKPFEVQ